MEVIISPSGKVECFLHQLLAQENTDSSSLHVINSNK